MKRIVLILSCILYAISGFSQMRPLPNWVVDKAPVSDQNDPYYYKVFRGIGDDEIAARNNAVVQAFQQADAFGGTNVNVAEVYKALEKGTSCEVLSSQLSIPIYFTCECSIKNKEGKYVYWILCQIAKAGNIAPRFNTQFDECNNCEYWNRVILPQIEKDKKKEQHASHANDARAIAASTFIPGVGQFIKGQNGAGVGFLLSELALVGGGTFLYFQSKGQYDIMKSTGITYDEYMDASSKRNTYNIGMWCCYGTCAAIHIVNMIHAYKCFDKKALKKIDGISLAPSLIPTNEYTHTQYAIGMGVQYKF